MKMKYRLSFTEYRLAVEIDEEKHADKKHQNKNLVVNLLKLIQVKKVIMQTMKLAEHKHLSVNLKTDN